MQEMAENSSFTELSPKQNKFIQALLAGNTIIVAAKIAKIGERTAYTWLKLPYVQKAYKDAQHEAFNESLVVLMSGTDDALRVLRSLMNDSETPPAARIRAAQIWLEKAIDVHKMSELEQKVAELEQVLREGMQ